MEAGAARRDMGAPGFPWEPSGSPPRSDPWRSWPADSQRALEFSQHRRLSRRTIWCMREPDGRSPVASTSNVAAASATDQRGAELPAAELRAAELRAAELRAAELRAAELRGMAIAGGDSARAAFSALWAGYYRRLSVFASAYRGLADADRHDAVADAIIAAFGALPSFDPRRPLSPWLYRIAANRFSDAARRAARMAPRRAARIAAPAGGDSPHADAVEPPAPGDHAAESADRDLVERCRAVIATLPELDRRIAMLRFYEELNASDIGRALGMPAGTVRWRISAIRATIRTATGEDTP